MSEQSLVTAKEAPKRELRIVEDAGPLANLLDTARFEHMYRIATAMAKGSFIPEHIRAKDFETTVGNCFRVVNQALRWGIDPWAAIDETYVVKGKLGYQGKLIAALVNARAGINGGLQAIYNSKKNDELAIVVYGSPSAVGRAALRSLSAYAESEDRAALAELTLHGVRAIRLTVGQAKTDNKIWRTDPEQKLFYSGATKWARRHMPEIILGVLSDDEVERVAGSVPSVPPVGRIDLRRDGATVEAEAEVETDTFGPAAVPAADLSEANAAEVDRAPSAGSAAADAFALEDFLLDIADRLQSAQSAAEFNAVGAELLKQRGWLGDDRYARQLAKYQEAFSRWQEARPAAANGGRLHPRADDV